MPNAVPGPPQSHGQRAGSARWKGASFGDGSGGLWVGVGLRVGGLGRNALRGLGEKLERVWVDKKTCDNPAPELKAQPPKREANRKRVLEFRVYTRVYLGFT